MRGILNVQYVKIFFLLYHCYVAYLFVLHNQYFTVYLPLQYLCAGFLQMSFNPVPIIINILYFYSRMVLKTNNIHLKYAFTYYYKASKMHNFSDSI